MTHISRKHVPAHAWRQVLDAAAEPTRQRVSDTVNQLAESLSDLFYSEMLGNEAASQMLDHALVNQRLHASMARWLRTLFTVTMPLDDLIALQQRTGEVHARIGVPIELVADGARVLKHALCRHLTQGDLPREALAEAIQYVHELIDQAIGEMNATFASNASRMARSDEAYRLFFAGQNMKAERERRRSELLEWAHQILQRYYWSDQGDAVPDVQDGLSQSQFGLWLHHKASMLFDGAPEIERIHQLTAVVENDLLPRLSRVRASHEDARSVVAAIDRHVNEIKTLLGSMFDHFIEAEDGRDSVTRLLNRRYFPSVAKREILLAQRSHTVFGLLMVDIDHFHTISQTLGQEAGDIVLAQVADALAESVRAGDFVFRVGDDQFLVLLVEASAASVLPVADGLRTRIADLSLRASAQATTSVTVSIGVALFDGHPDYQRMVDNAEQALRQAKANGRNRCHLYA